MSNVQIIPNLPFDEYLKLDRMSSSALKNFMVCPKFFQHEKKRHREPSAAFQKGTMVHTWMLENHTFQHEYYSMPDMPKPDLIKPVKPKILKPKKPLKKDGEEAMEVYLSELAGYEEIMDGHKSVLAVYEGKMQTWKDAVQAHVDACGDRIPWPEDEIKHFSVLPSRTDTKNEVTVLFDFEGVPCKARFDMLHPNGVEDLKTIADLSMINRDFAKYKYWIQAGFYTQAFFAAFGKWPEFFKFTFVSTSDYLDMITCDTAFDYVEHGRTVCMELLNQYKECKETNIWPGLSGFEIQRPSWV